MSFYQDVVKMTKEHEERIIKHQLPEFLEKIRAQIVKAARRGEDYLVVREFMPDVVADEIQDTLKREGFMVCITETGMTIHWWQD